MHGLRKRLHSFFRRRAAEAELAEELNAHLELQARKHVAEGLNPREARRLAALEFGGVEPVRESLREVDRWRLIDAAVRNLRHCVRSLAKSPGYVLVSILILSVGIGSNVAVFGILDALFLRPLPVERPDELVEIASVDKQGHEGGLFSTVLDQLPQERAFQGSCGFGTFYLAVEMEGAMRTLGMAAFSGGCFRTLGLDVQLGRGLRPEDDRLGAAPVAVITDSLWHSQYGGRSDVLGRTIRIGTDSFTIIGVTAPRFTGLLLGFPEPVMIPLLQQPDLLPNGAKPTYYYVNVLARRAPGISPSQAQASLSAAKTRLLEGSAPHRFNAQQRKDYVAQSLKLISGRSGIDYFLRRRFSQPLYAVFGLCGAMLLMACVNLSSLLLARSLSRQREIAVRLALGAGRGHIAAMLILENLLLVLAGTALGIIAGFATARVLLARGGRMFGNFDLSVGFDSRVVFFALAIVLFVIAAFSAVALWQARHFESTGALKQSGRGVIAPNSVAQKTLLAVQIALTLALVSGSALFGASVKNMYRIDFGIKPQNVWEALLAPRPGGYRNPAYWNVHAGPYYRDLLQQIESLPNVSSASLSDTVPFLQSGYNQSVTLLDGAEAGRELQAQTIGATDRYFSTLGSRIIAGDDFRRSDGVSREPGVIVTESLARHLGAVLGEHLRLGTQPDLQRLRITGIASNMDMNLADLNDTKPFTLFLDFWQHRTLEGYPVLLIKTRDATLDASAVRRIVDKAGHEFVERFSSVRSELDGALIENLFLAYLAAAFGMLALGMAAVGLFGLLNYQIASRTAEIGVRMALGATRLQIRRLVLGQIARLLLFGTLGGIALTFAVQKSIAGLLYGASASDPSLLFSAVAVLVLTALAAAWRPTHRASTIDPLEALRHE